MSGFHPSAGIMIPCIYGLNPNHFKNGKKHLLVNVMCTADGLLFSGVTRSENTNGNVTGNKEAFSVICGSF